MTKQELKDGDRLTLRNGEVYHYNNYMLTQLNVECPDTYKIGEYKDDLTELMDTTDYDIVKVERIQLPDTTWIGIYQYIDDLNNDLTYQTIWEIDECLGDLFLQGLEMLVEQPKKIEPLGFKQIGEESELDIITEKINEIIEVLNNGRR